MNKIIICVFILVYLSLRQLTTIYLLMENLGQITIDNSLNLTLNCQVDQSLLARNFVTIVNALKDLKQAQALSESKIKDLSSLHDKFNSLNDKIERIDMSGLNSNKQAPNTSNNINQNVINSLASLTKRVDKNETSILDSIKDINLLNKDLSEAKNEIQELKKRFNQDGLSAGKGGQGNNNGYGIQDIGQNLSKQLKQSQENFKSLAQRLGLAEDNIEKLQKNLKDLLSRRDGDNSKNIDTHSSGVSDRQLQDLKSDLKQKLDIINKKISNIQSDTNRHDQDIAYLKDLVESGDNKQDENQGNQGKKINQSLRSDLSELKKRIQEVNQREKKDVKGLQEQINSLKFQLKGLKVERIDSKTSIEEQNQKSNRKSTMNKDRDQLNDKLNDLILKVAYLEKLIAGSKTSLSDEKNPEKLPSIHHRPKRNPNLTGFQQKDKSGIGRKDLSELKAELEAWLRSLLQQNQNRQNFEGLQLKIQQIKKNLQRKADAEGTKKGFNFLQNKITQLYLFLTEPQAQDAMIVRKGFNCLSCSKKVEKLRGKLGPHLNWNNMTQTNYSPPRVGYSKPMGDNSIDKEDDL